MANIVFTFEDANPYTTPWINDNRAERCIDYLCKKVEKISKEKVKQDEKQKDKTKIKLKDLLGNNLIDAEIINIGTKKPKKDK